MLQCGEEGLEREIRNRSAVKPGPVLTGSRGHTVMVHVMGKAEHEYLSVRPPLNSSVLMDYVNSGVPCVVMCWGSRRCLYCSACGIPWRSHVHLPEANRQLFGTSGSFLSRPWLPLKSATVCWCRCTTSAF